MAGPLREHPASITSRRDVGADDPRAPQGRPNLARIADLRSVGRNLRHATRKNLVALIGRAELKTRSLPRRDTHVKNCASFSAEVYAALLVRPTPDRRVEEGRDMVQSDPPIEELFAQRRSPRGKCCYRYPPKLGTFLTTGLAAKLAQSSGCITRPPVFGEHIDETLGSHGI